MATGTVGPPGADACRRPEDILGVAADADPAAVRRVYLALARRLHPDAARDADPRCRARLQDDFIRITEAYRVLMERAASAPARSRRPPAVKTLAPPVAPAPPTPALPAAPDPASRRERVAEAVGLATRLIAEKDTQAAVSLLHEVLGLADAERRRVVRRLLARAYLSQREWRRYGLSLLNDLVAEDPRDAEALALLGGLYRREGLLARAGATLRRALAADPGHAEARAELRAVTDTLRLQREPAPPPARRGLVSRLLSFGR